MYYVDEPRAAAPQTLATAETKEARGRFDCGRRGFLLSQLSRLVRTELTDCACQSPSGRSQTMMGGPPPQMQQERANTMSGSVSGYMPRAPPIRPGQQPNGYPPRPMDGPGYSNGQGPPQNLPQRRPIPPSQHMPQPEMQKTCLHIFHCKRYPLRLCLHRLPELKAILKK